MTFEATVRVLLHSSGTAPMPYGVDLTAVALSIFWGTVIVLVVWRRGLLRRR